MKTKILLLVFSFLMAGFSYAQEYEHETTTNCDKKILKKIERNMYHFHVKDYLDAGEKQFILLTCKINGNKTVEVVKITGYDQEVVEAIQKTLEEHPVTCKNAPVGLVFTFKLQLKHWPA